jgi:Leucine-rich repeat (LRR) protein
MPASAEEKAKKKAMKEKMRQKLEEERKKLAGEVEEKKEIEEVVDTGPRFVVQKMEGELDFKNVSTEFGYLKARQKLKQAAINVQQHRIQKVDDALQVSKQPARLKEAVRLSNTLGQPSSESVQDKIMERAQMATDVKPAEGTNQTQEDADLIFFMDVAMRKAIIDDDHTLLMPEAHLKSLPVGFGDTVFLQMSYLNNISMPHNQIRMLLNTDLSMLSLYHLRYIKNINLSGNKLSQLPHDFGSLLQLESLDLSYNQMNAMPGSISKLKRLKIMNLANNSFTTLNDELAYLDSCTSLNMSENLLQVVPPPVVWMTNLKELLLNRNSITHMAVQPRFMTQQDLWKPFINESNGKNMFMNVLTKEKIEFVEAYTGVGIEKMKALHTFQPSGSKHYAKRKFWLSVCGVQEWDPDEDELCNLYYKNNVSGETTWDMPKELNLFGFCPALEIFEISQNTIKGFPSSIVNIKTLKRIFAFDNKLKELPTRFGELENLEYVDLHNNDLRLLPRTIPDLKKIVKFRVNGNQLVRLPDLLGTLPVLEVLDVTANRLAALPFSLGYCKSLRELHCQENPLTDPPIEETAKGFDSFKWYMRQRYMIDDRGAPPLMEFHPLSIMHEVLVLEPEFNERVNTAITVAKDYKSENAGNGYLNLQLMGLTDLPGSVGRAGKLIRKLRLDYNDHLDITIFPEDMTALRMLSLKGCKMSKLPDSINNLRRVSQLSMNDNILETLPATFTKLRSLTLLDLTNNRLYDIPLGFSALANIKTLVLEGNNIETIPPALCNMSVLQVLDLSKNRLIDIPDSLCDLLMLKKVNFERNVLLGVPDRIGLLSLVELRIGHNNIEALPNNMFAGPLGANIKKFSCCENNLLELPSSLALIDTEAFIEPDFNPLVSPPQYILAEGLHTIQLYLKIRDLRLAELEDLLEEEDFEYDTESMFPTATEVLLDGTGYLTPVDLGEFDRAVHEYLNAEYFKCPSSGVELVMRLSKLREFRETEIYLTILNCFNKIVNDILQDKKMLKLFSDAVLIQGVRPWGIKGTMTNVNIIALNCLLKDTKENKIHRKGRECIFNKIKKILPEMPFPFTTDLLKDALRLYLSPYGQVADTEQVTFPSCDCVGGPKNKPQRHDPCKKPAVVLAVSVYTEEEADRRAVEEDEFIVRFDEITEDVHAYLADELGMARHNKEVERREAGLYEDIELRDDIRTGEIIRMCSVREAITSIEKRKLSFEEGEEFAAHGFKSVSEPIALINVEQEKMDKIQARIDALQGQIDDLNKKLSVSWSGKKALAAEDMVQKYCALYYQRAIKRFRIYASVKEVKRPWDGEDGKDFAAWMRKFSVKYAPGTVDISNLDQMIKDDDEAYAKEKEEEVRAAIEAGNEILEFDWEDTDDMTRFHFGLYQRYKDSKGVLGGFMDMMGGAGGFLGSVLGAITGKK